MTKQKIKLLNSAMQERGLHWQIGEYRIPIQFATYNNAYFAVLHTWGNNLYKELVPIEEAKADKQKNEILSLLKNLQTEENYRIKIGYDIASYKGKIINNSVSIYMLLNKE